MRWRGFYFKKPRIAGASSNPVSVDSNENAPLADNSETVKNLIPEVLGTTASEPKTISYLWLLSLLILPLAYVIWKKKLYEREKITGLIRQTASAIFSFFF